MFQILDHVKCFHILSSLTTTGHWCPKWVLLGAGPPAVVPRDIDAPKINVFCRQEVSLSYKVKTKA